MKTLLLTFVSLASLAILFIFNGETDPFNAQENAHKITSFRPILAYAASPNLSEDEQARSGSSIVWHTQKLPDSPLRAMESSMSKGMADVGALCDNADETLREHPKFDVWCSAQ